MRVLSVLHTFPPTFGGGTKSWLRLISRIAEHGIIVDVLYRKEDGEVILQKTAGTSASIPEPLGTRRGSHIGYILTVVKAIWLNRRQKGSRPFDESVAGGRCQPPFIDIALGWPSWR